MELTPEMKAFGSRHPQAKPTEMTPEMELYVDVMRGKLAEALLSAIRLMPSREEFAALPIIGALRFVQEMAINFISQYGEAATPGEAKRQEEMMRDYIVTSMKQTIEQLETFDVEEWRQHAKTAEAAVHAAAGEAERGPAGSWHRP